MGEANCQLQVPHCSLQIAADAMLALGYLSIPCALLMQVRSLVRRGDVEFRNAQSLCLVSAVCIISACRHGTVVILAWTHTLSAAAALEALSFLQAIAFLAVTILFISTMPQALHGLLHCQARLLQVSSLLSFDLNSHLRCTSYAEMAHHPLVDKSFANILSLKHLQRLVEALLHLAQLGARHRVKFVEEEFELQTLLRQVSKYWCNQARMRKTQLVFSICREIPALAFGASTLLCQVLHQVFCKALTEAERTHAPLKIECRANVASATTTSEEQTQTRSDCPGQSSTSSRLEAFELAVVLMGTGIEWRKPLYGPRVRTHDEISLTAVSNAVASMGGSITFSEAKTAGKSARCSDAVLCLTLPLGKQAASRVSSESNATLGNQHKMEKSLVRNDDCAYNIEAHVVEMRDANTHLAEEMTMQEVDIAPANVIDIEAGTKVQTSPTLADRTISNKERAECHLRIEQQTWSHGLMFPRSASMDTVLPSLPQVFPRSVSLDTVLPSLRQLTVVNREISNFRSASVPATPKKGVCEMSYRAAAFQTGKSYCDSGSELSVPLAESMFIAEHTNNITLTAERKILAVQRAAQGNNNPSLMQSPEQKLPTAEAVLDAHTQNFIPPLSLPLRKLSRVDVIRQHRAVSSSPWSGLVGRDVSPQIRQSSRVMQDSNSIPRVPVRRNYSPVFVHTAMGRSPSVTNFNSPQQRIKRLQRRSEARDLVDIPTRDDSDDWALPDQPQPDITDYERVEPNQQSLMSWPLSYCSVGKDSESHGWLSKVETKSKERVDDETAAAADINQGLEGAPAEGCKCATTGQAFHDAHTDHATRNPKFWPL
eukprot:g81353.t1